MIESWQVGQLIVVAIVGLIMVGAAVWYLAGFFRRDEPITIDDDESPDDDQ